MDKLVKDGIKTLKRMRLKDTNLTELCIHMETSEGEILLVDIELDSLTGEIEKEYNILLLRKVTVADEKILLL